MDIKKAQKGNEIYHAGAIYEIAEVKDFPHGKMIGVFDQPSSKHIDYLNPQSVDEVYPCYACQGGGCPVCGGCGKLIGS